VAVETAELAVEGELLLGEEGQFGDVGIALGFSDLGAELAEPGGDPALLDLLDGALDLGLGGRVGFAEEGLRQEGALGRVLDYIHGILRLAEGERLKCRMRGKMLKPGGLVLDGLGGDAAGFGVVRVNGGECAEEDAFDFGEGGGARLDAVAALEGGLAELFAEDGGVDAELLGGVGGELVAG
jgi:hypothetical protein